VLYLFDEINMKADILNVMPNVGNTQEDERTLQIALELSNLGLLGTCDDGNSTSSYSEIEKNKKSINMTECVPVPSSEHVAEIVGRQGCKIKALRAKTNTYIKTPVRGEEPVFVVTGRKEDVAMARREVQSAAEHFTQIRASRNKQALLNGSNILPNGESTAGTITLQVRVPYRVVGLVVGPKGATIKRIQQQTHTYIVTPSRDKEPVFEVTGLPENVEKAKEEIEAHIAARTGTQQISVDDDFKSNGTEVGAQSQLAAAFRAKAAEAAASSLNIPIAVNNTASAFVPYNTTSTSILRNRTTPSYLPTTTPSSTNTYRTPSELHALSRQQINKINSLSNFPGMISGFPMESHSVLDSSSPPTTAWSTGCNSVGSNSSLSSQCFNFSHSTNTNNRSPTSTYSGSSFNSRLSPTLSDPEYPVLPPLLPHSTSSTITSSLQSPSTDLQCLLQRSGSHSVDSTTSSIQSISDLGSATSYPGSAIHRSSSFASAAPQNIESGYSSGWFSF
jgi:RNA-binding protein MEX3